MARINDWIRITELTCARLCHDLSGLLGTVGGALELVTDDLAEVPGELALAAEAAQELSSRLRLYRAAWGGGEQDLSLTALLTLAEGLPRARSVAIETDALAPDAVIPAAVGRLLLNLMILGGDCLPRGGRIRLDGTPSDLFLRILGPNAAWPSGFSACIADAEAAVSALTTARGMQMPLAALIAHAHGPRLSMLIGPAIAGAPPPLRLQT